jgi:hypothetical protein
MFKKTCLRASYPFQELARAGPVPFEALEFAHHPSPQRSVTVGQRLLGQGRETRKPGICDKTELCQMRPQRVRCHSPLPHQQRPSTMGHQYRLLLDRFCRHEPHRRALYGFAYGLCIQRIALAALH